MGEKLERLREKNPKRALFVEQFVIDENATSAAIRAGYTKKSARKTASSILANPMVREAVDELRAERMERTKLTREYIEQHVIRLIEYRGAGFSHGGAVAATKLGAQLAGILEEKQKVAVEGVQFVIKKSDSDED